MLTNAGCVRHGGAFGAKWPLAQRRGNPNSPHVSIAGAGSFSY